jgi:hypothetical protein
MRWLIARYNLARLAHRSWNLDEARTEFPRSSTGYG